ncbi:MAG: hypothetical protein ACF8PN_06140 [Phycisphaerales bacterium]
MNGFEAGWVGMAPLTLAGIDEEVMIIILAGIGLATVWVCVSNIRRMYQARQREVTRREVAAYVAEGSISPDDAANLLATDDDEFDSTIADAVAWGTISAQKAEKLIRSRREARAHSPIPPEA